MSKIKPVWLILGGIGLFILIFILWFVGTYNSLVRLDETANAQWANVESSYQRRFDLIPNLVETVKGAANFEKETYLAVTEARTKWLNAGSINEKTLAAGEVQSALARLLVSVENYPQLKATENFQDLQAQLEGTENRINVERNRYNEAVKNYNAKIRFFPSNLIAGMFGFEKKELFESDEGAEAAVKVDFT
ncbi:MAG: LemA family protein [Nanoarchaeota archaeon]